MRAQLQQIISDFQLFDNWLDRYQYIIDLGKNLEPYPEQFLCEENKVRGCQSQVWLHATFEQNKIHFVATSDAAIVRGLIYILLQAYNDLTPAEILAVDQDFIHKLELDQHLSITRRNGLAAMLQRICDVAANSAN